MHHSNTVTENSSRPSGEYAPSVRVTDLLASAAAFYQDALRASPSAITYLTRRGISGSAAARFCVGYASPAWQGLDPVLSRFDFDTVQSSGLRIVKAGSPARHFDRFRDRVMFPIRDRAGEVVGFGGRVMHVQDDSDSQPKYLNSSDSECFHKRHVLYGIYEAQDEIHKAGLSLVVEGYLDVISLSQSGFFPVVGILGTACTSAHIATLLELAPRVVFCFDGDAAGYRAAEHAMLTVLPFASDSCQFDFVFLPAEHDPDSFVRSEGLDAFNRLIPDALSLSSFIQQHISSDCNFSYSEGISLCLTRAKPFWLALPDGQTQNDLLAFCASISGFTHEEILGVWGIPA